LSYSGSANVTTLVMMWAVLIVVRYRHRTPLGVVH
jgi:hypothetical protein